jgi:ATP-binding cassette subfamily B protein
MTTTTARTAAQPAPGTAAEDGAAPAEQQEQKQSDERLRLQFGADKRAAEIMRVSNREMAARLPRLVGRAVRLAWDTDHRATAALLGCQLASGLLQAAGLLATTGTISAIIGPGDIAARLAAALPSVLVMAGTAGLRAVLGLAVSGLSQRLSPKVARAAERLLAVRGMNAELAAYDSPGYSDRWDAADRGAQSIQDLLTGAQNIIASAASLVAAAVVVCFLHPLLLPLLVLASLPQGIASVKGAAAGYLATHETSSERRALYLMRWWMLDKNAADQVRSNNMGPFLISRYDAIGARVDACNDRAVAVAARYGVLGALCGGLASCLTWGALAALLATGHIGVAKAGTAVFALRNAAASLQGIIGYGSSVFRYGMFLDDWATYIDEAGGHALARGTRDPGRAEVIRAESVGYRYEEAAEPALCGVDVELRRGEIIALVGENGSGKTTLGRLLSGLFLPHEGAVTWDGHDTRELDPHAVWQQTAVVPQNYSQWPLTCRENITMGRSVPDGDAAVLRAAAISGADKVVETLRSGLDTLLARAFWGGQELSGGQWQRLAIARAFYRPAALLVLDEPTSALDARGEDRVFSELRALARDRAVCLVTHRLQNVRIADRIYVLEKGRVIQCGTYDELLAQEGRLFHELWLLQNRSDDAVGTAG